MQLSPPGPPPTPDAADAHGGGSPTLGQAVGVVGPDVVEVLRAPCGTDVPVSGAGVFDEGETLQARGRILIAPGVDTSAPGAAGVLRAADRAGAAAVVLRRGTQGIAPSLAEAADEVSTALLARAPWIEWGELIGLLRAAIARTGTAAPTE
ncbi:PucR family transcriptional regulator, partial [Streptomyces sp. NPDC056983]